MLAYDRVVAEAVAHVQIRAFHDLYEDVLDLLSLLPRVGTHVRGSEDTEVVEPFLRLLKIYDAHRIVHAKRQLVPDHRRTGSDEKRLR